MPGTTPNDDTYGSPKRRTPKRRISRNSSMADKLCNYCTIVVILLAWSVVLTMWILPRLSTALYGMPIPLVSSDDPLHRHAETFKRLRDNPPTFYLALMGLYYVASGVQAITLVGLFSLVGFCVPIALIVYTLRRHGTLRLI